jgi:perosamine synthetase
VSGYGPAVAAFEHAFAAWCGVRHGVGTSNGTTALHLALAALGLGPGDEVVLPALTIVSVLGAVRQVGATPVLVDVDREMWTLEPEAVRAALTPRTRAVVAVHLYGLPCDMAALRALAAPRGIVLVEDAAEAHGATVHGRRAGSLGDLACFSFFANKIVTCGEGGMVVTSDDVLAARMRALADLDRRPAGRAYVHEGPGFNYRLCAMAAALGSSQLARVDAFLARRRRTARLYAEGLAGVEGLAFQRVPEGFSSSCWMTAIRVDDAFGEDASALGRRLAAAGIDTRPVFLPLHRQPFWGPERPSLPVSEALGERGLLLPSGNQVTDDDVQRVIEAVTGGNRA